MIHKYDGNEKTVCGKSSLIGSTLLNHKVDCNDCKQKIKIITTIKFDE